MCERVSSRKPSKFDRSAPNSNDDDDVHCGNSQTETEGLHRPPTLRPVDGLEDTELVGEPFLRRRMDLGGVLQTIVGDGVNKLFVKNGWVATGVDGGSPSSWLLLLSCESSSSSVVVRVVFGGLFGSLWRSTGPFSGSSSWREMVETVQGEPGAWLLLLLLLDFWLSRHVANCCIRGLTTLLKTVAVVLAVSSISGSSAGAVCIV